MYYRCMHYICITHVSHIWHIWWCRGLAGCTTWSSLTKTLFWLARESYNIFISMWTNLAFISTLKMMSLFGLHQKWCILLWVWQKSQYFLSWHGWYWYFISPPIMHVMWLSSQNVKTHQLVSHISMRNFMPPLILFVLHNINVTL